MAEYNSFTYDGITSSDFGVYIGGEKTFDAPALRGQSIEIPGRNGNVFISSGSYENVELVYPSFNFEPDLETFRSRLADLRNALSSRTSYKRLTDTLHPDEFRMAVFRDGFEAKPIKYNTAAEFDIVFDCKPQRFLKSGEVPYDFVTSYQGLTDENSVQLQNENGVDIEGGVGFSNNIVNPTEFEAKPLIHAKGNGIVNLGSQRITISGLASNGTDIYIDCESMEIYTKTGSIISGASSFVAFNTPDFPVIPKGASGFTYTMDIAEIIPRWWRI